MAKKNVYAGELAGMTFNQYELEYTYVEDGETLHGLMPVNFAYKAYPILLVSKNGENLLVDERQFDFEKHPEFSWAKETYKKLREDIKKLDSLPDAEGSVWRLFQQQGGFLALCENGGVHDVVESLNGKRNFPTEKHYEGGATLLSYPIISVNSAMDYSGDKVLLHELTHNACHTLTNFAHSDLFKTVVEVERAHRSSDSSDILPHLDKVMTYQIQGDGYTEKDRYDELICRLHEERLKNPAEFKKQLPVLDCFYQNFLYPSVLAYAERRGSMAQMLETTMEQPNIKTELGRLYDVAHERVLGQRKCDRSVEDILWPINASGYCQRDEKGAQKNPAYRQVCQEQVAYQLQSQKVLASVNEDLITFMQALNQSAKTYEKKDKRALSDYLKDRAEVGNMRMQLKGKGALSQEIFQKKEEYVNRKKQEINRPDNVKKAWKNITNWVDAVRK